MAGKQGVTRLLTRHRASLVRDLDTNKILPHLVAKEVISTSEERHVLDVSDPRERTEVLLDIVGKRGLGAFHDFCSCLEKVAPHLLTGFLLEHSGSLSPNGEEKKPTQALQLSLELALNERDLMLRENAKAVEERDQAIRQLELLKSERDSAFSLENNTGKPSKNTNTKSSELSPPAHRKSQRLLDKFREMEPETDQEDGFVKAPTKVKGLDNVTWETHNVTLRRVPGFGFGIAVSGGRDNPHFANGDPSIAISDVLTAGPAEGKLLINDRVMSVNGIPLENVDHKQAIAVLKDSGNKVNLVIRRRVLVPTYTDTENTPLKITLSRKNRREDFGVVLGCKYFIKEITGNSIAAQDGGLKEGDVVLKINSTAIENLSLVDAKKLIEKTKDKLQLFIAKTRYEDRGPANKAQDDEYSLGYGTLQGTLQNKRSDIDNVNIYRPSLSSPEEEIYKGHHNYQEIPPGSYPNSEHARYDGRYIYDHEAPPRPPLPDETDAPPRPPSPGKELLRPDDFYSPRSPRSPHPPHSPLGDGYLSDHGRMDPHGQRRHDERYVGKRKDIVLDPRFVYFEKEPEFGLGLRLAGGNATGIFIASVQPGSGAEAVGLTEGDQILKANDVEIPGMTREDAVTYLTSLEGRVSMVVQYKREEYDRIISSHEAGDSFFIRTHFEYQAKDMGELSFTIGDIFHIKDTLFRGVVGSWLAMRIGRNNQETQKGFIPNRNSAEQIFLSTTHTEAEKENTPTKSRSLLFKRKAARRSKSLGKDHWEDVIFSNLTTKFPAYERVTLRDTGFVRPVVIFGALADVAREKLLQDFPDKFESPQTDASSQGGNDQRKSGIIRLGAIKEIINKRKHCLLDVTPHNVDKLNYSQYYPIVVFLKAENKNIVKDCRAKFAKGSTKNHKKLFEQSQKLEKLYPHLFTATISHNNTEVWYSRLQEMIHLQQEQQIWMSEHKPEDNVNDDFLFPMGSRASYSPAQDTEPGNTPKTHPDDFDASPKHKKRLVRSSSDPSINTTDRVPGIPPYPAPPSYHRSPGSPNRKLMDDRRYVDFDRQSEDRYYPSYYASESLPHGQFPHTRSIEPYATITHHERLRSKIPEDGQWYNPAYDDRGPQKFNPEYHRSEPDLGRHVNHNRPSTASLPPPQPHQTHDPGQGQPPHPPHHSQPFQENASSYSSDSYSRYTSNPVNRHDDSKLREKFGSLAVAAKGERSIGHDPYRFTRSTANPVNTANIDKSKLSDLSARYRKDEHPPTRKQSLPSPVISPSVNQPPASSAPPHHAPLQQDGAPPRVKKEPPPVPVKTYHLRDRGIEPDDLKIRNYENSNRAYNYADPSSYSGPDQKHHYNEQNENPYDYVAPRQNSAPRSRTSPNQNAVYARPYASPDRHSREGSYDRGRSFMNQIYMDTEQLQKLRARQESHPPTSNHGNREVMGARDSGYPGPERPRDHSRAVNHEASDRERSSHEDSSDHGSAFEAYRKPAMSTFGKVPAGKGFEPSKHISATLSSDTNPPTAPTVNSSSPPEESAQRSEDTDQRASDNAVKGESSNIEQVNASNTFLVGSDNGQLIEGNHTVVATARGVFDHQGGVLESPETGVSIVIPKGAIPEGVSQEIYFKVCKDNNILPPLDKDKGETLLSPLVMCGPHGLKFLLPVELRLPHCASVNPDSWSFALKSSDSPTGHPTQWQNMTLAGMDGVAQGRVGKNSVSVLVDHF
ncbi:tight junction protein ZO-1-like isoform X9 [Crassostrea angulata]|uniref:tight junction protein ZO-1-like isoform X9 n=1 Tax=Magallana angulata TaxID=2784310 RepID=UPI0022B17F81|nr:tight junction protein ZO-1-like isoform X9 [Crassostrea angulata]